MLSSSSRLRGPVLSLALLATTIALVPELAFAQSAAPVEGILEWFVGVLQGSVARSLAIIAVCFLGFLFHRCGKDMADAVAVQGDL